MGSRIVIRSNERGYSKNEWFSAYHTFSYGNYYNPNLLHFGVLRALNDIVIAPLKGFTLHNHENMEIITIPLKGMILSQDHEENCVKIRSGCLQAISAGNGIFHSEYNASESVPVEYLQLLFLTKYRNSKPQHKIICYELPENKLQMLITPKKRRDTISIAQTLWLSMGRYESGKVLEYKSHQQENGIFIFIIDGEIHIEDTLLKARDSIGISEEMEVNISIESECLLLIMEFPMITREGAI